ncbi:hypothetical protein Mgra_00010219 [Meloidogyne graminicola]|uniref:Uncharacterized protein n=1 Tax=Meloidogyne graminicola TaxID=189291 RepID=A0A8S9ZB75_9BILA|nr:hypothetical protein Mgra_00010219 [Meloidogyne graminicola]
MSSILESVGMFLSLMPVHLTIQSRCIISADQAVHFCGFAEEVNKPPILPHLNGFVKKGIDTSCTDAATNNERSGLVAPPVISKCYSSGLWHLFRPDNFKDFIRQYRNHGKPYPRNETEIC